MEDNISCPVCCDIFKDPVLLMCSHSFCRACLKQCWERKGTRECPVCRREATGDEPPSILVLKTLCEDFLQERNLSTPAGSESLCGLHGEKLKLFCLDHEEAICLVCQTSEKHEHHKLRPVQEAALKYRNDLGGALKPLQGRLEAFHKVKETCDQTTENIKRQSEHTERRIREEFEKLHRFLRDEEANRITSLKKEEKEKGELVKKMAEAVTNDMKSLSHAVSVLEQDIRSEDIAFLQRYKDTKKRIQSTVQDPERASLEEIDVTRHLGHLKNRVMEKMLEVFQYAQQATSGHDYVVTPQPDQGSSPVVSLKNMQMRDALPPMGTFQKLFKSCGPKSSFEARRSLHATRWHSQSMLRRSTTGRNVPRRSAVMDNVAPLSSDQVLQALVGRMRGIQGHSDSSYIDTALFSLFSCSSVLDSLLFKSINKQDAPIQSTLLQQIVNPLRRNRFVPSENVVKLCMQLHDGGYSDHTFTIEEKDPGKFLALIMHCILPQESLLTLSAGETVRESYCHEILLEQNHSLVLPSVQQLLEHTLHSSGLRLAEIPSCLILQIPNLGKKFNMLSKVIPSLELDISDLLAENPRECVLCGCMASFECTHCFMDPTFGRTGLKQFCATCCKQVHLYPRRKLHTNTSNLRLPEGYPHSGLFCSIPREKLQLFAVICSETNHYVSFVRHGPNTKDWIFFDSMADRHKKDGHYIPIVKTCPDVGRYLEMPRSELAALQEMDSLAKHLFCNAYMYLYQNPSMAVYR